MELLPMFDHLQLETTLRSVDAFFKNDFKVYDRDAFVITTSKVYHAAFLDKCLIVDQMASQVTGSHTLKQHQDRLAVAVVDRSANLSKAAGAIARSKTAFGGTSPFAVDVVLVNEWIRKDFIAELEGQLSHELQRVQKTAHSKSPDKSSTVEGEEEILFGVNGALVAEIPRP